MSTRIHPVAAFWMAMAAPFMVHYLAATRAPRSKPAPKRDDMRHDDAPLRFFLPLGWP